MKQKRLVHHEKIISFSTRRDEIEKERASLRLERRDKEIELEKEKNIALKLDDTNYNNVSKQSMNVAYVGAINCVRMRWN